MIGCEHHRRRKRGKGGAGDKSIHSTDKRHEALKNRNASPTSAYGLGRMQTYGNRAKQELKWSAHHHRSENRPVMQDCDRRSGKEDGRLTILRNFFCAVREDRFL